MDCGCKARQDWLNRQRPGLGDRVKTWIDAVLAVLARIIGR